MAKNDKKKKLEKKEALGGRASPGVTGAATERPLEGVAKDPTRAGYTKTPTPMSGRDYKGGAGAVARGIPPPSY